MLLRATENAVAGHMAPGGPVVGSHWLSLYFTKRRQEAIKSLSALKLDVTVSYVGHALQTGHVF